MEAGRSVSRQLSINVQDAPAVSAVLRAPPSAGALLVLAHGAGAGMEHPFMEAAAGALADRGIATLRFQFPYMEAGKRRPDRPAIATAAVRAAVEAARAEATELAAVRGRDRPLSLFAGGKSFGGRMTSTAAASAPLPGVAGLIFLGFPLHPAGRPGTDRADHLANVTVPMLFVQGTRDRLARLDLLRPVLDDLGDRATLHVVDGGDHSFKVLKRSGRTGEDVMAEIGAAVAGWASDDRGRGPGRDSPG